jgi:hypothetical protein
MKQNKGKSTATTAYGEKLPKAITFPFDYSTYESADEIREKNDWPADDDIVDFVNAKRLANARAKAQAAAFTAAGIEKPTLESNDQLRLREMVKVLMSSGRYTDETAREMASTTLGISWAE